MPTFAYTATDDAGKAVSGLLFASDESRAQEDLGKRGLAVSSISRAQSDPLGIPAPPQTVAVEIPREANVPIVPPVEGPSTEQRSYAATSIVGPLVGRVPLVQLAFYFRQLGTMLNAGVPMVQSLDTLSRQAQSPKLREVISEIRGHVLAGRPMSAGMQRYPEVFTPVMMSITRIGESGGFLDRAMNQIADYTDRELVLRQIYKRVTFYPKLELTIACLIIVGANAIINSVKPGAKGLTSPLTTLSTWFWLGPLIVFIFLFIRVGLANPGIRYLWDSFIIHIPYLGNTIRQLSMAKFGRAFGALYSSGVPMPRAVELSADACGNEYMRARIAPVGKRLEEGAGVAATLATAGVFSPIVLDMVATGETTGGLDQMIGKVSEYYEQEAEVRSVQTAQVIGMFIGLCVMIYIAYIIISFYSGYGQSTSDAINGV